MRNCIEYHKEAIQIRVESIKIELDKLCENLFTSLDDIEIEMKAELDDLKKFQDEILARNEKLVANLTNSNIEIEAFLKNMNKCQENMNEIENFNKIFSNKLKKIKFEVNDEWWPESELIGEVKKIEKDLIERLKMIKTREFDMDVLSVQLASGMCSLSNKKLLLVDTDANEILVLNKNFELEERINEVNGEVFNYPLNICTDSRGETVYLCDYNNSRVLLLDVNLKHVKKILTNTTDYIGNPIDICFYGDCLFILDSLTSNIKQFLHDGTCVRDINLVDNLNKSLTSPVRLTIHGNYIAVLDNWKTIHVYDMDGKYKDSIQQINEIEMNTIYFYDKNLFCIDKKSKFKCYNMIEDKIKLLFERVLPFTNNNSDYMIHFDNKLIIAYCYSNFLAIFDL